jgi:hypothetical protein
LTSFYKSRFAGIEAKRQVPGDKLKERLAEFPKTACLRARLIILGLKQQLLLSRDREGAVLLTDSAEFCKSR